MIKGGHVVDPGNKKNEVCDILVDGQSIADVGKGISARADQVIDASGMFVIPGRVDMHEHLRDPGREDNETVARGTSAAAKGGVTTVVAMPNTDPSMDSSERIRVFKGIIAQDARINVFIAGAITRGRKGIELVDINALHQEGVIALTDDGSSVDAPDIMRSALKQAHECGLRVLCHCEDTALSAHGVVNLGLTSTRMGLRGISTASEYERVKRDIQLAREAGVPVHIQHVSCRGSVEIIAEAKKKGFPVTAETAPHYFSLTEEAVLGFDPNTKMNPPLRSSDDLEAVRQGLKDGVIDAIASDHAPHTENEKDIEFERAAFGVIGLETELAIGITELVYGRGWGWPLLVEKMALNPARILGLEKGTLGKGRAADIVIVDPDHEWVVTRGDFVSKSKNSCFLGRRLRGAVMHTLCAGRIVYSRDETA